MVSWTKWQSENQDLADWRSTADYIESIESSGDVIVTIDTRPFEDDFRFGFVAAPRYYDGDLPQVTPNDVISSPESALRATRFHFVLFVPKMAGGWSVPPGWEFAEFSEMMVFTTGELATDADRIEAWWAVSQQMRPDVAVRTQIAGVSLEESSGVRLFPWAEIATEQAAELGEAELAVALLAEAGTG
jgi:hypothetical protein